MNKGFTLVELIVVFLIISILVGASVFMLKGFSDNLKIEASSKMILSDLNMAGQEASSQKETKEIVFNEGTYTIDGKERKLSVKIINPQIVRFSKTGNPIPGYFGTIQIRSGNKSAKIVISAEGRVRIE